jgi:hypothetical protein
MYYGLEGGKAIEQRRTLATRLGIAPNALRIRLHRLRARLEDCARRCLERAVAGEGPDAETEGEP